MMSFSENIYKYVENSSLLTIGEVKLHQAYLYSKEYEVAVNMLHERKVVQVEVRKLSDERKLVLSTIGTVNCVLGIASGYIRNH